MASPRYFAVYARVGLQWKAVGQGWEGQGGELIAPAAALEHSPIYVYVWSPDTQRWSGGYFDAAAAAATRPKVIVSVMGDAGVLDTANVDSLLWQRQQSALTQAASQYGLSVRIETLPAGVYPSRNIYARSGWNAWMQASAQA